MIARIYLVAAVFLMTSFAHAAAAKDALPLKRGIYVRQGVSCIGASNADTLSYWGDDNGINNQQEACKIKSQRTQGSRHILSRSCRNGRFESNPFRNDIVVYIRSHSAFSIDMIKYVRRQRAFATRRVEYRYCGPSVILSPQKRTD